MKRCLDVAACSLATVGLVLLVASLALVPQNRLLADEVGVDPNFPPGCNGCNTGDCRWSTTLGACLFETHFAPGCNAIAGCANGGAGGGPCICTRIPGDNPGTYRCVCL
jgi:hypothetical protein